MCRAGQFWFSKKRGGFVAEFGIQFLAFAGLIRAIDPQVNPTTLL
jgi:hypothetical protein